MLELPQGRRICVRVIVRCSSASWLNLVECWFSILTRPCLERGTFSSTGSLKAAIQAYIVQTNLVFGHMV